MFVDIDIIMRVFMKKILYQMSINMGRTTTTQGSHTSLCENSLLSSLSLLVKSFEEEIQPSGDRVDTAKRLDT